MSLTAEAIAILARVSTATITTVLLKKGLRNVWMRGARPLRPGQPRLVGAAFTLRFVPAREDLATPESWASPISTRAAIEAMPEGCIAVVDAMGVKDAGIFGDILCARMVKRGVAALVTDGVVRDLEGVLGTGLPVWCDGVAAPPSVAGLTFVGWGEPIGCGGVAVFPDDIVVADQDGAVLIPQALLDHVLAEGPEQERMEGWIVDEVNNGAVLPGLYPMNAETKARYAAFKAKVGALAPRPSPTRRRRWRFFAPVRDRRAARAAGLFHRNGVAGPDRRRAGAGAAGRGRVSFEPGARTAWHTHPLGQTLYVVAGVGRVQTEGGPVREIRAGDTVWIPPGEKHWHGAAPTNGMTHIAMQEALDGSSATWLEQVTRRGIRRSSQSLMAKVSRSIRKAAPCRNDGAASRTGSGVSANAAFSSRRRPGLAAAEHAAEGAALDPEAVRSLSARWSSRSRCRSWVVDPALPLVVGWPASC